MKKIKIEKNNGRKAYIGFSDTLPVEGKNFILCDSEDLQSAAVITSIVEKYIHDGINGRGMIKTRNSVYSLEVIQ